MGADGRFPRGRNRPIGRGGPKQAAESDFRKYIYNPRVAEIENARRRREFFWFLKGGGLLKD